MDTSIATGCSPSPSLNKENTSDIRLREDDSEQNRAADPKVLQRATLKIDLYLIPLVGLFYLLSFMDRSNIGNARVAGLTKDLGMTTNQFSTALSITYVPYILMELPMNLLMKRLGANVTLPVMAVLWGLVCACQGAVHSYHGLLVCRFFLGVLEGGLSPGVVLLLSSFYKRHALQLRFAMMFSVTSLAGAFSGLLAFGIQHLDGKHGIAGWQWIFIVEGVVTIAFGLLAWYFVPTSPRTIKILNEEEREAYCRDLADDWSGDADADGQYKEEFSWNEVASAFTDAPHVLIFSVPAFFTGLTVYGLANFTPTIVSALGNSPSRTQLLTVPPFACSFIFSIVCAYFCDKYKNRGVLAMVCPLLAAIGYSMFLGSKSKNTAYAALYFQIIGSYGSIPCQGTWLANNIQPHYRRATAVAFTFLMSNIGGIVSPWLFTDPPRFHKATSVNLAASLGIAASSAVVMLYFRASNAKRRKTVENYLQTHGKGLGRGEWDSTEERRRLGDRHPRFELTL